MAKEMLFKSTVEKFINESYANSLDAERSSAIKEIGVSWDFYYGHQEKYIKQYSGESIEDYAEKSKVTFNYTKNVVDEYVEGVFAKPVTITLTDHQEMWDSIADPLSFFNMMPFLKKCQRIAEVSNTCVVMIRYDRKNDMTYFEDIRGEFVHFLPSTENPRQIGTMIISYTFDTGEIDPQKRFMQRIEIWDDKQWAIWLYSPTLKNSKQLDSGKNPYGFIPAIRFQPQEDDNTFYGLTNIGDIVKINSVYNNLWTSLVQTSEMQSFSVLVVTSETELDIQIAPKRFLKMDNLGGSGNTNDAKYITPSPKIDEVRNVLLELKKELQDFSKVPASTVSAAESTSPESGYALTIKRIPIEQAWENRRLSYGISLRDLVKKSIHVDIVNKGDEPPAAKDIDVAIEFSSTIPTMSPSEQTIIDSHNLRYNLATPIDWMQRKYPELTRAEALKKYEENKKINEELGINEFGAGDELDVYLEE